MRCIGNEEAKAIFTRRTLTVTCAPIFNSRSLIVAQVAVASLVPASAMRLIPGHELNDSCCLIAIPS